MEIPELIDSGSSGTQQSPSMEALPAIQESPLKGLPIAQTIEGLAATRSKNLGGEVAANLLAGSFSQLSYDLQVTRQELLNNREELRKTLAELSDTKTKAAVLQERVNTTSRARHLKNFSMVAGSLLLTFGIELYKNNFDKFGYIASGLGAVFILLGWFSPEGGEK